MEKMKTMKSFIEKMWRPGLVLALLVLCAIGPILEHSLSAAVVARPELPAGASGYTAVIEVTASETTIIPATWNDSTIKILQGFDVVEKFRAAIGTSTISTDLPLLDSLSVSLRSGGFVTIQTATDTAKFAVYHTKE